MTNDGNAIAQKRRDDELRECLGAKIRELLADTRTTDIMLNPDSKLWADRASKGRECVGSMTPTDAKTILRLVAFRCRTPINRQSPIIDNGVLPGRYERISGTVENVTDSASFAIRVPPRKIQTHFPDAKSQVEPRGASEFDGSNLDILRKAVAAYKNLAIVGSTGSGKTSLMSLLLQEMQDRRLLVFEDTRELVVTAPDHVRFLSIKNIVTSARLLELALRYRPDSIIVGELRKPEEARVMVQSANTGHRGSITGFHANSAEEGLNRLEDLCSNAMSYTSARAISSAIDMVAFVEKIGDSRCITKVIDVSAGG